MIEIAYFYAEMYNLAIHAGACKNKARFFANKQTIKETGVNVFDLLGMTKRSKPTKEELLYAICSSDGVSSADLVTEYPFLRFNENDLIDMLSSLEQECLIKFSEGLYKEVVL